MKHKLSRGAQRKISVLLAAGLVAFVGTVLLDPLKADTPLVASESEAGTLAGGASLTSDAQASGSAAVKFDTGVVASATIVSLTGNDTSGDGTAGKPFKTFAKALSTASAGTTIYARAGSYTEKFEVTKSGSTGNPITIAAYPGEKVKIVGGQSQSYGQAVIYLRAVHDVVVRGFEVGNTTGDGRGIAVEDGSNITIADNIAHDVQHAGIDVSGSNITVDGNEIYNACLMNQGSNADGGWPPALTTKQLTTGVSSSNIDIINNYVHDSWGEGIDAWFLNGGTIDNNRAINNYSVNIYADDSKDLKITNNFMQSTNDTHNANGKGRPSAIAIASELGVVRPTNMIINGNNDAGGHSEGIVWHHNGVIPITQSPNPQDMP